jgi:hypothetical protein
MPLAGQVVHNRYPILGCSARADGRGYRAFDQWERSCAVKRCALADISQAKLTGLRTSSGMGLPCWPASTIG